MSMSYIKYFFIILCSFYLFKKILALNTSWRQLGIDLILTSFLTLTLCVIKKYADFACIAITTVMFSAFVTFIYKTNIKTSFLVSTLSFGLSYVFMILAIVIATPVLLPLVQVEMNEQVQTSMGYLIIGIVQLIAARIPFLFRRLKKGMPFLKNKAVNEVGFWIGLVLLFASSAVIAGSDRDSKMIIYIITIILCGLILLIWWHHRLTNSYIEKRKQKEMEALTAQVQQLNEKIAMLEQQNTELSSIIHKDNKLIPAMEFAVIELLHDVLPISGHLSEKALELEKYLSNLSSERTGMLELFEKNNKHVPCTNVVAIDAIIRYMVHKASIQDIDFHFSENASIKYLVDNIASENDIATLLAELSENAIISVSNSQKRHILLCCSIESSFYSISIFDSGAPFDAEVIEKMGKSRVTTHADSGGSGIGMMTILEISKKYHASFYLNEIIDSDIYNKKITIYFDGLNQFLVESNANSENTSIAKSPFLARNASQFETY